MILWLAWTDLFDTCRPHFPCQSSNGNTRGTGDIGTGSIGSIGRACARVDAGALGVSVQASTCYLAAVKQWWWWWWCDWGCDSRAMKCIPTYFHGLPCIAHTYPPPFPHTHYPLGPCPHPLPLHRLLPPPPLSLPLLIGRPPLPPPTLHCIAHLCLAPYLSHHYPLHPHN